MNIPIYRAKKIDSEEYIEGFLAYEEKSNKHFIIRNNEIGIYRSEISGATLAIHFPDMIDKYGTKIFASLSEDGKGGDVLRHFSPQIKDTVLKMINFGNTNFGMLDLTRLVAYKIQE